MGTQKLSKPFQVGGGRCGLSASARNPNKAKGGDGVKSEEGPSNQDD